MNLFFRLSIVSVVLFSSVFLSSCSFFDTLTDRNSPEPNTPITALFRHKGKTYSAQEAVEMMTLKLIFHFTKNGPENPPKLRLSHQSTELIFANQVIQSLRKEQVISNFGNVTYTLESKWQGNVWELVLYRDPDVKPVWQYKIPVQGNTGR